MKAFNDLLYTYKNGNYLVKIFNDGSKVRFSLEDSFNAVFPESVDLKITNYCDNNCAMCHENSSILGEHASFNHPFLQTLKRGTELAIGGGNPFSHPDLFSFLTKMKNQGVICNITVNQAHFVKHKREIEFYLEKSLIYGLGISVIDESYIDEIIEFATKNSGVVIHLIAGIVTEKILSKLSYKNLKILILGYKEFGRGIRYYSLSVKEKIDYLKENVLQISKGFKVLSFDNLAIDQLEIEKQIPKADFDSYYMGDDGQFTMYIDLVKKQFAINSVSEKRFGLLDDITEMFKIVKNKQ